MNWRSLLPPTVAVAAACAVLIACRTLSGSREPVASVPEVVTADIQAGIEKHIEERSRAGGGYLKLAFGDKKLRLKLVRVHTEYLANLGPRRHFAVGGPP